MTISQSMLPTDEQRVMLRDSLRGYLQQRWTVDQALKRSSEPQQMMEIWRGLAEQGLAGLGSDPAEGGLREILLAMEELGRVACPAPLLGAALTNLALRCGIEQSRALSALLPALLKGEVAISLAFGEFDGDVNAGAVRFSGGMLDGKLAFVEGAVGATHILVIVDGPGLAIVERDAAGLTVTETPGLVVPPLAQLEFNNTPASLVAIEPDLVSDLNRVARLMLVARALGAANRGFEMVVEYAKERHQFGQPIGKFQAIQHKLADCLTSLEGVRLTLSHAASSYDLGETEWRLFAAAACAFAGPALRQVSLETHHTFGAIGYAEEHEAPRHFRRTHGDLTRFGGVRRAREELAQYLLDDGRQLPDYDLGPSGNAFRQEVRDWLEKNWAGVHKARHESRPFELRGDNAEYLAAMGKEGWIAMNWPTEFGGQARTPFEQLAFIEEVQRADAPMVGKSEIQAVALMKYGTPEQQAEFLPKIRRGEISFCLGYSEPGSGSDLASLKTRARREGDEWVINGQKIWTTGAERADYMWLAARTDPEAKTQHAGISIFIVPMKTPGISIQPSMALYGHTFCTEFLDDVRVPASALIGSENGGWAVIMSALATERILMGGFVANIRVNFERLAEHVRRSKANGRELKDDHAIRDGVGSLAAEIEVARQLLTHSVGLLELGRVPIHEAAMSKAYTGELMERLGEAALDILGMGAALSENALGAITNGKLEQMLRQSIMMVIGGGTGEIQRSLIAQRGLGLPR